MFPNANFPSKVWKHDDPLDTKERNNLSKIMKESSSGESEGESKANNAKSSGVWNSKLHFAWDAVLSRASDTSSLKAKHSKSSRLSFIDFWTEAVDSEYSPVSWFFFQN
jgi:DNA polymerase phi